MEKASAALTKRAQDFLALEAEEAQKAGALGFMARALVQATMPHSRPQSLHFQRTNGAFTLTMAALRPDVGLPYGTVPRLLMAWLTTEAVKSKSPHLVLGESLSDFMRQLGMVPTGGRWGSILRLREQIRRLFSCAITCTRLGAKDEQEAHLILVRKYHLWWDPKRFDQRTLFESTVDLQPEFFQEVINNPVPIDLRVLKFLARSPLAIDAYTWLTHRMSYLRKQTTIPWPALQLQFGAEYGRLRDFKAAFSEQLEKVVAVYPVRMETAESGLLLKPSRTHIRQLNSSQ
jgi:Plasmid encoded RepA protein